MAYSAANPPLIISEPLGSGPTVWQYTSTDSAGTIAASGYFSNGAYLGMAAGDVIFLVNSTTGTVITASMLSSTSIGITSPSVANSPTLVAQSFSGWTRSSANTSADTSYVTVASITVPGGTMGLNSVLGITLDWSYNASNSSKVTALDWGGANVSAPTVSGAPTGNGLKSIIQIQNKNSLSIQTVQNNNNYGSANRVTTDPTSDTSANVVIDIKCKWVAQVASEAITLLGYSIWHYPGN